MQTSAAFALLVMIAGSLQTVTAFGDNPFVQVIPVDDAHTLFQPNAPDPGRSGQTYQLPQGGTGVTTGGTSHYQTLGTPGGSGVAVPNGNGTSSVVGSGGQTGTATTPR